jgi:very-short-patch-repair endonuclease
MQQRARDLRRGATNAEQKLWSLLRGRRCGGLRFLRQAPAGQYVLDFYCPVARLAIEVDGEIHNLPDIQQRDNERQQAIETELRITFLRLTNEEVLATNEDRLNQRIQNAAQAAQTVAPPCGARPARLR